MRDALPVAAALIALCIVIASCMVVVRTLSKLHSSSSGAGLIPPLCLVWDGKGGEEGFISSFSSDSSDSSGRE